MGISIAIAFCLILAAILSVEFKISSAVLEIFGGIALAFLIVDIDAVHWLDFMAKLGMLALMFIAGFEIEVEKLRKTWRPSVSIGIPSLLVPMIGVYLFTTFVLGFEFRVAALISIGLSTTSLALVYYVLKEQQLIETHEGQVAFGAASVVDVLSMVSLALLLGDVGWGTAIFVLFLIFTWFSLPHFGSWLFKRYPNSMAEPELRFLLVILVSMSFLAEEMGGIHPAIVAFTLGIVMSGTLDRNEAVKDKLMGLVFSFFAPLFFLDAGTRIDISGLTGPYLLIAGVLFALATLLKYYGTYLPARFFINSKRRFCGVLFNYRLSFGIITASVGLETGILNEQLYSVIMLVVVISALYPSLILKEGNVVGLNFLKRRRQE